ncbi:unnamed protein product, partial [Brenthis ino]
MACFCVPVLVRVRSVCVCACVGRIASVATARCAIAPSSGPRGQCSSSFVSSAIGNCIKVRHRSAHPPLPSSPNTSRSPTAAPPPGSPTSPHNPAPGSQRIARCVYVPFAGSVKPNI